MMEIQRSMPKIEERNEDFQGVIIIENQKFLEIGAGMIK